MRSDFCNQVFSFSENDLEDDDKLDCTGGYDNDDDDIYIMMKCLSVCVSRKISTSSLESPISCPHDPAR